MNKQNQFKGKNNKVLWAVQSYSVIGSNCVPIPGAIGVSDYLMLNGFRSYLSSQDAVNLELLSRSTSFYCCILICGFVVLFLVKGALYGILVLYILASLIRLAYYNVTEEERKERESGVRKYYLGLPVTSAALIFPFVVLLQYIFHMDVAVLYLSVLVLTGILFLVRFQIRKPGWKGIMGMVAIGVIECILLILSRIFGR